MAPKAPTQNKKAGEVVKTQPQHPLAHKVPSVDKFLSPYVSRLIDGTKDLDILEGAHRNRMNVLLEGPTGSAKTSVVYAYGAHAGLPVINIPCNGAIDLRSLFGGLGPKEDGGFKFFPSDLVQAVLHGGIVLFNEINFAPPKILAVAYGLLDKRKELTVTEASGTDFPTTVTAHEDLFVVADCNPGYIGTRPLSEALRNRFAIKLPWDYSTDVEDELIGCPSLQKIADAIRQRHRAGDLEGSVPTNLMLEFLTIATDGTFGVDFAITNFVNSFVGDEKQVVQQVFELHYTELCTDLGVS